MKDYKRRLHQIRHGAAKSNRRELLYLTFREKLEQWWENLSSLETIVLIINIFFLFAFLIDLCDPMYFAEDWRSDLGLWFLSVGILYSLHSIKKH